MLTEPDVSMKTVAEERADFGELRPYLAAGPWIPDFLEGFRRWRTWVLLAYRDILIRYRRSLLGPFWISISMAVMVLSMAYLYGQVFQQPFAEYLSYLACGFLAWNLISGIVNDSCSAVTESEAYLRNVPMPLTMIACRAVFRQLVYFGHNVIVVVPMVMILGKDLSWVALEALVGVALYGVLGVGATLFLAPLCARFRDLPQIVTNVMQVFFFLTPIFWMPNNLSARSVFVEPNPFHQLISLIRQPILGQSVSTGTLIYSAISVAIVWAAGLAVFLWSRRRIQFWL